MKDGGGLLDVIILGEYVTLQQSNFWKISGKFWICYQNSIFKIKTNKIENCKGVKVSREIVRTTK